MSAAPKNAKPEVEQALKHTANELREAQKASNKAFNLARRGVLQLQSKLSQTSDQTFRKPAAQPAATAKRKANTNNIFTDSDSDDDSIFYAKTGMTPPPQQVSFEQTFKSMDAVSPGLSDGLNEENEVAHTPNAGQGEDMVLVQAQKKSTKKSPSKKCPSCGAEIPTACRKCPHCGAPALRQDIRSKRERKRRRERKKD